MHFDKKFWAKSQDSNNMILVSCSDYKHELNVCFFEPEVLARYNEKPSRYQVEVGMIQDNEEGWILQSFYVSSDNEVYCYLVDLQFLPPKEQKYWQIYNIKCPKGSIDELSIKRDFECSFEDSKKDKLSHALVKLQQIKIVIDDEELKIWKPKENFETMINEVQIPLVDEYKQYKDNFLLPLARLVIEGFDQENLVKWATKLEINSKQECEIHSLGSLNILKECLLKVKEDSAEKIERSIKILKKLHNEKSSRSSHGGPTALKSDKFKVEKILDDVISSLLNIIEMINDD